MFTRRDLLEMVIVGATGGTLAACVVIAARLATDPGDVLGFFGGAVGAGLAVIGALAIERRKDGIRKKILTESLVSVAVIATKFRDVDNAGMSSMLLTLKQAIKAFDDVRSHAGIDDAIARLSISAVVYWLPQVEAIIDKAISDLGTGKISPEASKATFQPIAENVFTSIRSSLKSHPYWPKATIKPLDQL